VSVCFISSLMFLLFDTTQMFITAYTRARTSFHCKSTSTHLYLGLPSCLFASGTPTKFHQTRQTAGNSRLTLKLQRAETRGGGVGGCAHFYGQTDDEQLFISTLCACNWLRPQHSCSAAPVRTISARRESGGIAPFVLNQSTRWWLVVNCMPSPLYPGNKTEAGWAPEGLDII